MTTADDSQMLRQIERGVPVCFTVALLDGLVLARSGFHSSINYRPLMAFGVAEKVEDEARLKAGIGRPDYLKKVRIG